MDLAERTPWWAAWQRAGRSHVEWIGVLTSLVVLLYGGADGWLLRIPMTVLALAALIHPPLLAQSRLWLAQALLLGLGIAGHWVEADNHQYLLAYWLVALALAHRGDDPERALALTARWLLALTFFLAALWKALSPDFRSGAFFAQSLLLEPRFTSLGRLLTGIGPAGQAENERLVASLMRFDGVAGAVTLRASPILSSIAAVMTWWTLALESALAVAFAFRDRFGPLADLLLLVFLVSTYPVAPVIGFGWTLIALGFAQSSPARPALRATYLGMLLALQALQLPWKQLLP
jgi:hypothetical protein